MTACLQAVGAAVDSFLMVLGTHKWTAIPSVAARSRARSSSIPADQAASSDAAAQTASQGGTQGGDPSAPPYTLMEHPPLAVFVNGLLAAFNELRHCAPLSMAPALASIIQVSLPALPCGAACCVPLLATIITTELFKMVTVYEVEP